MSSLTEQVVAICRAATAHNHGQTVTSYGTSFLDGSIDVEMSSWPRAKEACKALTIAGYDAEIRGEHTVRVLPLRPFPAVAVSPS